MNSSTNGQNVVKGVREEFFSYVTHLAGKIKLESWRVEPGRFAILELESKKKGAGFGLAPFLLADLQAVVV